MLYISCPPAPIFAEEINDTAMISTMNAYMKTGCIFPASVPKPIRINRQGIVISKKTDFSVGQFVLLCNVVIFGVAGIFFGIDRALYSLLAYFITSKVVDEISEGLNKAKAAMIITNDGKEITEAIYKNIGRTVTKLEGTGFISGNKEVLYCVITRVEIFELKRLVQEMDESAFITILEVSDIIGTHIKSTNKIKKLVSEHYEN